MAANTLTVGNVQIVAIHDNEGALPLSMTFPNVPAESWTPYQQRYPEGFSGAENLRVHFDCYLVRSQGRIILVDTGGGSMATNPGTVGNLIGGVDGRLTSELRSAGVGLEDVDTVFLTHLAPRPRRLERLPRRVRSGSHLPQCPVRLFGQADWEAFRSPERRRDFWVHILAGNPCPPGKRRCNRPNPRRAGPNHRSNGGANAGAYAGFHEPGGGITGTAGVGTRRRIPRPSPGHRTETGYSAST